MVIDHHASACQLCTEIKHSVVVSVNGGSAIPPVEVLLRHKGGLQPLLLRAKAVLS